jgi:hypothetical protein
MSAELAHTIRALVEAPPKPVKALRWLLGLAIGLIAFAPIARVLITFISAFTRAYPPFLLLIITPLVFLSCYAALARRFASWRQRRALQQELERHLGLAGSSPDADDPHALALRAEFWERAQRQALEDLRARLAQPQQPTDLLVMMWRSLVRFRAVLLVAGSVWGAVTGLMVYGAAIRPAHLAGGDALGLFIFYVVVFIFVIFYLLVLSASGEIVQDRVHRRALKRETHRVVNLIETAGGLSLAEGEIRDILQGAIEPAGAVGGELTMRDVVRDPAPGAVLPSPRREP